MSGQRLAITFLACAVVNAPAFAQTPAATTPTATTPGAISGEPASGETWLAVSVNQQPAGDVALFIRQPNGHLLATAEKLKSWRLRVPAKPALTQNGDQYFALDSLPGLTYRID